ncbi:hypothetical protein AA103196_2520 [Ameyamaea chiangmaiensis NBRC 103196]|nr:hypothetical protein AA103196_2520 [Ameyamaea chiangmaiensis NBRC 103196]
MLLSSALLSPLHVALARTAVPDTRATPPISATLASATVLPATATVVRPARRAIRLTDTSLPTPSATQVDAPAGASLTHSISAEQPADGFSAAPVPDDDMRAPMRRGQDLTAATIEPDLFSRSRHLEGSGFSDGSQASDRRRGHGSAAAGLQLTVPVLQ